MKIEDLDIIKFCMVNHQLMCKTTFQDSVESNLTLRFILCFSVTRLNFLGQNINQV